MAKHTHALLMAEYAKDALIDEKPWLKWQYRTKGGTSWHTVVRSPSWYSETEYRKKIQPMISSQETSTARIELLRCNYHDEDANLARDLLADLMHWCDHKNIDFDHELMVGKSNYVAELPDTEKR